MDPEFFAVWADALRKMTPAYDFADPEDRVLFRIAVADKFRNLRADGIAAIVTTLGVSPRSAARDDLSRAVADAYIAGITLGKQAVHGGVARAASARARLDALPLATVLSHAVPGTFGTRRDYIKTYEGWFAFEFDGTRRGEIVGTVTNRRIPLDILEKATDEGSLGMVQEGLSKGDRLRSTFQLDAMAPNSVIASPDYGEVTKRPDGRWAKEKEPQGFDSIYFEGYLGRGTWVR